MIGGMITRNCDWCNKEYTARSTRGKTCSRKCSDNLYNKKNKERKHSVVCSVCNKEFLTNAGGRGKCYECSDKIKTDSLVIKEVRSAVKDSKRAVSDALKSLDDCLKLLDSLRVCVVCGKDYCKDVQGSTKYCSNECKSRVKYVSTKKYKRININKYKRLSRNGKADYSISLDKLIDRDGLNCHICGGLTNKEDKYIHRDGKTIICGNDYPSIDHVIPIAKGGLHQWDNVKVAHRICNSQKRDKI